MLIHNQNIFCGRILPFLKTLLRLWFNSSEGSFQIKKKLFARFCLRNTNNCHPYSYMCISITQPTLFIKEKKERTAALYFHSNQVLSIIHISNQKHLINLLLLPNNNAISLRINLGSTYGICILRGYVCNVRIYKLTSVYFDVFFIFMVCCKPI